VGGEAPVTPVLSLDSSYLNLPTNRAITDAEDLVMKLFSATLYDAARRWYLSLPEGSIKTMDKLEEIFLKRWSVKEDPNMLLTRLYGIAKRENESIREFHTIFEAALQRVPPSHQPKDDYLVHLYTRSFNG
jgi:hypothetical protein